MDKQQKKKIERDEERLKNNNRDLSLVKMKSMSVGLLIGQFLRNLNCKFLAGSSPASLSPPYSPCSTQSSTAKSSPACHSCPSHGSKACLIETYRAATSRTVPLFSFTSCALCQSARTYRRSSVFRRQGQPASRESSELHPANSSSRVKYICE